MGLRANLIIIENGKIEIYYTHTQAENTPNILAQGLEFCEKHFRNFDESNRLMNNTWAEGGILMDKDQKKVLIFGGADIAFTPALQRLYCKYMTKIWKNWTVHWCSKGNIDFAEYLGIMEEGILAETSEPIFYESKKWSSTMKIDRTQDEVITTIKNGIINDYKQDWGLDGINVCIAKGEELIDLIPDTLKIEKWHNEIETTDCLLVDYDTKKIVVCWGQVTDSRYEDKVKKIWSGWKVLRQTEGLTFHFDYTNRDKSIIEMTDKQFEKYCEAHNLVEFNVKI